MAGRSLVSRPGRQHGTLLGCGAGHQTAVTAGDLRSAFYVDSGCLKYSVPAHRGERCDPPPLCASRDGVDRRRGPWSGRRLDGPDQPNSRRGGEQADGKLAMCPVCLATVVWIAAGAISTGGISGLAVKKFRGTNTERTTSNRKSEQSGSQGGSHGYQQGDSYKHEDATGRI